MGKAINTAIHAKLLLYYNSPTLNILNIAAFLDPHFKSSSFLEEEDQVLTNLTVRATYF